MKMKALSIVFPSGSKIAKGEKTIEVRSWKPPMDFSGDLLLVENHKFLRRDGETDLNGTPVAIVKIRVVREYLESDIPAACASSWEPGYFSWELFEVRPLFIDKKILAARGIYEIDLNLE